MESNAPALALAAPRVDVDALPYIDSQYNDPKMKQHVDALIAEEMKTFKPSRDYLEHLPLHETTFEVRQGQLRAYRSPRQASQRELIVAPL